MSGRSGLSPVFICVHYSTKLERPVAKRRAILGRGVPSRPTQSIGLALGRSNTAVPALRHPIREARHAGAVGRQAHRRLIGMMQELLETWPDLDQDDADRVVQILLPKLQQCSGLRRAQ
jgi:hypothetical protein